MSMSKEKEIKLSYIWDKKSYIEANRVAYDYALKSSPKRFLGWIFIAMSQFGVVSAMKGGGIGLLLLSSILILYWYYFRWKIREVILIKNFEKSKNKNYKFNIMVNSDGLDINNTFIEWKDILEFVSLKSGFLLYYESSFLFIPSSAFRDIEIKNLFASIAREKIENYNRVD